MSHHTYELMVNRYTNPHEKVFKSKACEGAAVESSVSQDHIIASVSNGHTITILPFNRETARRIALNAALEQLAATWRSSNLARSIPIADLLDLVKAACALGENFAKKKEEDNYE